MNLITKYLTPEGRAFRYKQDITKNLEAKLFSKAVESFCLLFKHFAQRKEWADLSDICPKYLADLVEHKASLASKLTNVEIEQAIAALRANQLLSPAIFLGDYFDSHNQVIDLYAQTLDPHKLFFYIESKKLLNLKTITDAIQQWEQHNSAVSAGSDFALHLKRIASENPNWIPQKAHIKESIENYDAAAELYKSNNDRSKAAFCYEKAGKYQEAIDLYKSLGHKETVSILAEKIGDYETAIQYVVKPERKFDLLLKTEKLNEALAFAHGFPNVYDYVSLVKEKAKSLTKKKEAEHEYISALEYNNLVGDEVLKNTLLEKARAYYLQQQLASNNSNRLKELIMKRINLEESTANYALAGKIAEEELKDTLLAIHYYEKANLFHKAIKLTSENLSTSNNIELIEKLAELHNQGGNLLKAASLYVSIKQYENAYNLYQSLGNYEKAIECYLKLQYQDENILLDLYHSVGNYSKLIEIYMNKNTYTSLKTALEIAENSHDLMKASLIKRKLAAFKTYSQDELEQKYNEALTKTIQQYSSIIGIDFGTTTSVCAIYNKESRKVEIITNPKGGTYIDSYFAITAEGGYIFGDKAKLLSLTHPDLVVPRVKRYLGENKKFIVNNKIYTTEEIIAHQLSNLRELTNEYIRNKVKETLYNSLITIQSDNFKDVIEDFLQKKVLNVVKDAVLTVPAYFNDSQKRATRDAADIAGLNIRRLLHEPTAAAVAFEHQRKYKGKIAIIDLGGGTFDISIVDIDEGVFNVDKIGGNTKLGGSDIDELLFLFFQKKIKDELWVDLTDQKYKVEASRLKDACENLKINLSNYETYRIELPFFLNMPEYILELSRKELEHISDNFFKDFQKTIKETLDTFNEPIDHFILVGNATKMPKIAQLSNVLIKAAQLKGIDPGVVVATGAAVDAAILLGDIKDKLIIDIVPFSLGISVLDKKNENKPVFNKMIECNSTIPATKKDTFTTASDNQDTVTIRVYQGEYEQPEQNHFLGKFDLTGIPLAKAGVPQIEVTFEISADCILKVTARDQNTNRQQSIGITGSVRLSNKEKQDIEKQFKHKANYLQKENEINQINRQIEKWANEFSKNQLVVAQLKPKFLNLFAEKLQNNPYNYKANIEQAKIIQGEVFLEKEEIFLDNQKFIDRYTSLLVNIKRVSDLHLDYTAPNISEKLEERLTRLDPFLKNIEALTMSYKSNIVDKLSMWVSALESIMPDIDKMTLLQKISYLIVSNNIKEAIALLESNFGDNLNDLQYIETLLTCYKKIGDLRSYKTLVSDNTNLLNNIIPNFNRLNDYLKDISDSIFFIEVTDNKGNIGNGSGFSISQNLIVTNRHVLEGATEIKIIGKKNVFYPIKTTFNSQNDIALLTVNEPLKKLRIGVSEFIEPGEKVIAIGFPSAQSNSFSENIYISQGVVNSIRRHAISSDRVIFIDNKIGAGMSGGPLINDIGEVVGISTLVHYRIQDNIATENQPIALPIHLITQMMTEHNF